MVLCPPMMLSMIQGSMRSKSAFHPPETFPALYAVQFLDPGRDAAHQLGKELAVRCRQARLLGVLAQAMGPEFRDDGIRASARLFPLIERLHGREPGGAAFQRQLLAAFLRCRLLVVAHVRRPASS